MPSEDENIQYLYLVLTHGANLKTNWDPVCTALQLEKGAVTKRWSRLKQSMEKNEKPTSTSHEFLWLMVKHSTRDKPCDWEAIAKQCNSTKGACSKRYSRLKIAFEKGDAPPSTPAKGSKFAPNTPKTTPRKSKVKTEDDDAGTPTATPKRKRITVKKEHTEDDEKTMPEANEDEEAETKPKRARGTPKSKVKPKPKNGFRASDNVKETEEAKVVIKDETSNDGDVFLDAPEHMVAGGTSTEHEDEVLPASTFSEAFTHAREMADVLLNRKSSLTEAHREELEDMINVFGEAI